MGIHPVLDVPRHFVGVKIVEILQDRGREKTILNTDAVTVRLNSSVTEQQAGKDGLRANCDNAFRQGLL